MKKIGYGRERTYPLTVICAQYPTFFHKKSSNNQRFAVLTVSSQAETARQAGRLALDNRAICPAQKRRRMVGGLDLPWVGSLVY
jgi:hypothetical protein